MNVQHTNQATPETAQPNHGNVPQYVILRRQEVLQRLGIGGSTLERWTNPASDYFKPDFPKPIYLAATVKGFLESEINDYIAKLAEAREHHPRTKAA